MPRSIQSIRQSIRRISDTSNAVNFQSVQNPKIIQQLNLDQEREKEKRNINFLPIANYKLFNNLKKLKVHKGPVNFSAVTMRDPNTILELLGNILTKMGISYMLLSAFCLKCDKNKWKFLIEINLVERFPNLFILKFYKNTRFDGYFNLCDQILDSLQMC